MKKIIYNIFVGLLLISSVPAGAQRIYNGQIGFSSAELKQQGNSMLVSLQIDMDQLKVDSERGLTLTPILIGKEKSIELPEILINGSTRQKAYIRSMVLDKEAANREQPYAVLKSGKDTKNTFSYTQTLPYEPWMADAHLDMKQDLCGCGGHGQQIAQDIIIDRPLLEKKPEYIMRPSVAYIQPEVEAIKSRNEQKEIFLNFPVNKTVILTDFMDNRSELAKTENMLKEIKDDNNLNVTRIDIVGYASPEGPVKNNEALSKGRTEALKKYLSAGTQFPADIYHVVYGGENWDGLVAMVEASQMADKEAILSIIRETSDPTLRKNKLKQLKNGVPYKQMLSEYYPKLRKVNCNVYYNVRNFSVEEGKEILKTRPQQLSQDEMYRIANTYEAGSDSFNNVFETAVRMYPNDKVANLNAAASALSRKDLNNAGKYLDKSDKDSAEYANNMGIYYMFNNDYSKAKEQLTKAAQAGSEAAKMNLKEVEKKLDSLK